MLVPLIPLRQKYTLFTIRTADFMIEILYSLFTNVPGLPNVSVYIDTFDMVSYIKTFASFFLPVETVFTLVSLTFAILLLRAVIAFIRFIINR